MMGEAMCKEARDNTPTHPYAQTSTRAQTLNGHGVGGGGLEVQVPGEGDGHLAVVHNIRAEEGCVTGRERGTQLRIHANVVIRHVEHGKHGRWLDALGPRDGAVCVLKLGVVVVCIGHGHNNAG